MPVTINGTTGISTPGLTNSSGDMTITNGNLVLGTSGKGIDFSVTSSGSGTMTSELLSDYEEGDWTPTLSTTGTDFNSVTYSTQTGKYVKIGKVINYYFNLVTSAVTIGSASGDVVIANLPFNNGGGDTSSYLTASGWATNIPSNTEKRGGQTQMRLKYRATANGATTNMAVTDVSATNNTCTGIITIVNG